MEDTGPKGTSRLSLFAMVYNTCLQFSFSLTRSLWQRVLHLRSEVIQTPLYAHLPAQQRMTTISCSSVQKQPLTFAFDNSMATPSLRLPFKSTCRIVFNPRHPTHWIGARARTRGVAKLINQKHDAYLGFFYFRLRCLSDACLSYS